MKKAGSMVAGTLVLAALSGGVWALAVHPEWFQAKGDDDEDAAEVIPLPTVHLGKVVKATLHRYVEGNGTVEAQPRQNRAASAGARIAPPQPGIVRDVLCESGLKVEKGALLFQLDNRQAAAEVEKAEAALGSARASLAKLKAFPRPEQIAVAAMQVDRARRAVEYSAKKHARQSQLAADQLASEKLLQEAELELIGAKNDLAIAEKQLVLLQGSPTREEVAEAEGKVLEAEKALAGAKVQYSLTEIRAPLSATVLRVRVSPGEAVDLTTVLAELVDLDRLVVEGTVPSARLKSVSPGMAVQILPGADPGAGGSTPKPVPGNVIFVGFDIDRKADAGSVRVSLPPGSGLAPGQFVRLRIVVEEQKDHLAVPRECIVRSADGKDAIVGFLGEKAVQKPVQVGIREGDLVGIEGDDVNEGDSVVTQGAYGLPGEAKVRVEGGK